MVTKTKDGWYDTVAIPTGNQLVTAPSITGHAPGNGVPIRTYTAPHKPEPPPSPNRKQRRKAAALRRRRT